MEPWPNVRPLIVNANPFPTFIGNKNCDAVIIDRLKYLLRMEIEVRSG